jgi:hypothetical protein
MSLLTCPHGNECRSSPHPIFTSHEDQLFCPLTVHVRITEGMMERPEVFNINKRIHRTTNPETWKVSKYPTHINTRLHFKFATNTPPNMLVVRKWSFTQRMGAAVSPCANPEGSHIDIGSDRLETPLDATGATLSSHDAMRWLYHG